LTVRADLGDRATWGDTEELLARTVDRLGEVVALLHAAWFKPPHPEVVPVPRPGGGGQVETTEVPRMSTAAEIRAFFTGDGTRVVYSES
jgi:hypothetical protein